MSSRKVSQIQYALNNKALIQEHMAKHRQLWQTPDVDALGAEHSDVDQSNVRVFVRVRPLLPHDVAQESFSLVDVQHPRTVHFTHPTLTWNGGRFSTKTYEADSVVASDEGNTAVWERIGLSRSIEQCISQAGRELYVLAYGQTGTGKTYTTTSIEERISQLLFGGIDGIVNESVYVSAFEIRSGNAYDLLSTPSFEPVKIVASVAPGALYPGLGEQSATSAKLLMDYVRAAGDLRTTRSTIKNDTSSRSHSVMRFRVPVGEGESSSIFVVDLAGSERSRTLASNADPLRAKEGTEINQSLAALKDCIRARLSGEGARVPWRGSKLTMVLRRAFADVDQHAAQLCVIACVSPSVVDCEDTINTLNYVTPFRLSAGDAVDAGVTSDDLGIMDPVHASQWDHETSASWITRNLAKFGPVLARILPRHETIATLSALSPAELSARISTPAPKEKSGSIEPRVIAQAKANVPTYHPKLQKLMVESAPVVKKTKDIVVLGSMKTGSKASALEALSGRDPRAHESGLVTRVDMRGKEWTEVARNA